MNDVKDLVKNMTLAEKAAIVAGTDFMYTNAVPRLNIESLCMADGPHGLRKQRGRQDNGFSQSEPATAFPTAATTACGWNEDNLEKMGAAIAGECRNLGVDILLGPGANIKRNPRCGRNFEYFSEDPLLAGKLAAAEVRGLQSAGVGACVKHFALNNGENFRFMGDSIADMRAIREIYLKVFEIIVKQSRPYAVMCAYNKINGVYCSDNGWLLNGVLRGEWGFEGAVMTDWGAMHDRVAAIKAGLDLEMPGDTKICRKRIVDGVKSGELKEEELDLCVERVLKLVKRCITAKSTSVDFDYNHWLAGVIAADSAVLIKNDGLLPLSKGKKLCVVGELFENMRYQGAGSSMINPARLTSPMAAFKERGVDFLYLRGYDADADGVDEKILRAAVEGCKDFQSVLVFAGLTDRAESEGGDREHLRLPENQLALIDALIAAGKEIILVLFGGSPVELPFADGVGAILNMYLPGQNGGGACAELLFGEVSPSGKLAESWYKTYADVPFGEEYSKSLNEVYKESIFVGYRYLLSAKKRAAFPFGFGLSYTSFSFSDLRVRREGDRINAEVTVKNTGKYDGAEVVELFVAPPKGAQFRPVRELRAFKKVFIKTGEEVRAELSFPVDDLKVWDIESSRWVLEGGVYTVQICRDCERAELSAEIAVEGETKAYSGGNEVLSAYSGDLKGVTDEVFRKMSGLEIPAIPPVKPITMESRFTDLRATFFGRIVYNAAMCVPKRQLKRAKKMPAGQEREYALKCALFLRRVLDSGCLHSMSMSSTMLPYNVALGIKELANCHIFRALRNFCRKIKAPELPKSGD